MRIQVLELDQYVAKFHERLKPGRRYSVHDRLIYRDNGKDGEDVAELPEELAAVELPTLERASGVYIGDRETIARLHALDHEVRSLLHQIDQVLRS